MKIETLLIGHAIFSGAGTIGSVVAFVSTHVDLLFIPFMVFTFILLSDISKWHQLKNKLE